MSFGYPLLFLCHVLMLDVSRRLSCRRFAPATAFFFTWCVSLGLLALGTFKRGFEPPPLPVPALLYLLGASLVFLAGTALAHTFPRKPRAPWPNKSPELRRESYRGVLLRILAVLALLCTALHIREQIPNLTTFLATAGSFRDQITDPTRNRPALLSTVASYASMIVVPVAGLFWLRHRVVRWWMVLTLLAAAALAMVSVGKFFFIFTGLTFINCVLYHSRSTRQTRFRFGPLFGACLAIGLAFVVVTSLRDRRDPTDETDRPSLGLIHTVYVYATRYVPAFGSFFEEYLAGDVSTAPTNPDYQPDNQRPGNQTFSGIYRLSASLGLARQSASNRYEGTFNVYTLHRDLIMDFGPIGSLVCLLLLGFSLTLLYRALDRRQPRNIILLSLLTTQMEFSLIYSLFGFIFYPLVLVAAPLLVGMRRPAPPAEAAPRLG